MAHLKNNDGIEVTFLKRISVPLWFIYEVKIENTSKSNINYNMRELACNSGVNALLNGLTKVLNYELLSDGIIGANDCINGYVAFERVGFIFTNQPKFMLNGMKTRIKPTDIEVVSE